jgi:hypothetical protein
MSVAALREHPPLAPDDAPRGSEELGDCKGRRRSPFPASCGEGLGVGLFAGVDGLESSRKPRAPHPLPPHRTDGEGNT